MTIVRNRLYNDPALGAAFGNIAAMFAPPSAQDLAAYASAEAKREEAEAKRQEAARLAEFYSHSQNPETTRDMLDRLGVGAGVFNPSQGYYAVDQGNATQRYGHDRSFEASRLNNTADNERALATNAADNRRQAITSLYGTVGQDAIRPAVPAEVAGLVGLPELPQVQGNRSPLSSDQVVGAIMQNMPTGDVQQFARDKFAPSETQVKGRERERLATTGILDDQTLLEAITGERSPVQAIGPDGAPVFMSPGAAVREGAQPFINRGAEAAPRTENYVTPDGRGGTAMFDPDNRRWIDTATRQPLPQGSRTYNGQLQGGANETGFGSTNSNLTEATRLESSLDAAEALVGNVRQILSQNPNVAGVPGRVKGAVQSLTSSAQQVAAAYAADAPDAALSLEEARQLVSPTLQNYDDNIVRVASAVYDLAYMRAQIGNPSGEVSRQAFERALESFGQSFLSSQQDLDTALRAFEQDTIAVNRVRVDSLRGRRGEAEPVAPRAPAAGSSAQTITVPAGNVTIRRLD